MQAQAVEEEQRLKRNAALSDPFRAIASIQTNLPSVQRRGKLAGEGQGSRAATCKKGADASAAHLGGGAMLRDS